ncbi:hypothetical protein [Burkholderia glumae]
MSKKLKWCKAKDAGQYFGLDAEEVADLILVMDGYRALFGDLDLKYALQIVMRSGSEYEFFVGKPTDIEHGSTKIEIHKAAGVDEHYEVLEFDINIESLSHHQLSKSEDFPHNLIRFLAGDINDHYLASDDATDSERQFAREVYDALIALWEKRIFEKKFGK